MVKSEKPESGNESEDQNTRDKSKGRDLEWIEEFIEIGVEAMSEIDQAHEDSQSIIENIGIISF